MNKHMALLMMCACLGCTKSPAHRAACPAIEMSAVADEQSDTTRTVAVTDGSKIPLTQTPLVTSADVTGARASLTDGQWVLNVDMTDAAAKRVRDFTRQNVGRTVAFLVEGKVRSTPTIKDPITGKGFLVGGFDQADAQRLATAISNGCKP
jgi:preprotein translocase subunit SecD